MAETTERFDGRYVSLTSFRRNGTAVATPVWFVEQGGRLLVETDQESGKVKRIRANPEVSVAPCNGMGHLRGAQTKARAQVLDPSETARVEGLIKKKYRWDMLIIGPLRWTQRTLRVGRSRGSTVALVIVPEAPPDKTKGQQGSVPPVPGEIRPKQQGAEL